MTATKPGKTLTQKKKPATADSAAAGDGERRKRSGARARQVEQLEREREKQRQALAPAPAARPEASSAPAEAPPRRTGKPRSASPAPIAARQPLDQPSYERDQYAPKIERTDRRRPRQAARAELFPIFAPCPHGLEEALAAEMKALGFDDAQPARAGCRFHADWTGVRRAKLYFRMATRIMGHVEIGPRSEER